MRSISGIRHAPACEAAFARALLDPQQPVPAGLQSYTGRTPGLRFGVYRNNVIASLINALRTQFPATERITGEEYFAGCARAYIAQYPPRSKLLVEYGNSFGDFLAGFPPAAELPYLADVARVEAARTRAYHAADADPLDPQALPQIEPDRLCATVVSLHPSLQIVRSDYPAVTVWAMNSGEMELGPVDMDLAEDAMILRPRDIVDVHRLPPGGADFVTALRLGLRLGEAADAALAACPAFDPGANLSLAITSGLLTGASTSQEGHIR